MTDVVADTTTSELNKQERRSRRSTNALLEAASDLIDEGGIESLTFAAIGERAGYSRGLVTARFGSKDGLIEALIDRIVGTWNHRNVLPRTIGKPGLDRMMGVLEAIRRQAEVEPRGLRVLYSLFFESLGPDDQLRARFVEFHHTIRNDFTALLEAGRLDGSIDPSIDAVLESELIVSSLRGAAFQWRLEPDDFDIVRAFDYLCTTTRARIAARDEPTTSSFT